MSPSKQHRHKPTTNSSPPKNSKNTQNYQQQQQQQQQLNIQSSSSPLLSPSIPPQNLAWSTASSNSSINHTNTNLDNNNNNNNNRHNSLSNHHSSGLHREPRPSNSNRRSSSNTAALRYQQQQAQARAHAHVQAQLQAHVQAHQVQQLSYYQQHMADLATYITQVFLPSVLPTPEEYQIKEQTRQHLETLADKVSKGAKLLPFGSIASGLALRNSDMDLCYLADPGNKFDNNQDQSSTNENTKESLDQKSQKTTTDQTSSDPKDSKQDGRQPEQQQQPQPKEKEETKEEKKPKPTPAEMVMILGQVIQQETAFMVKMLPKARIPIIKLSLPPSLGQPFGLSCDIGFENRLALENTRLLLTYAMVDPRMRTIVLFLKVWSKRRRINDPYLGTLSSYGYVLMVIFYLVNGRKLAVLPNLQQLPPPRVTTPEESVYEGHDIYFFDDLDALPRFWVGMNRENVGELLIEFFRFFSSSFRYTHDVISVRTKGGIVSKESKGWMHDIIEEGKHGKGGYLKIDLNRLCIEDPFQTDYNVARTVTRDGLFTIRGEFMRAVRVLSTRTDRLDVMIRELCEERQEGVLMAPPSSSGRRKSAPNSKTPLNMSLSGGLSREEEEEDDLEEQLLLQQQQALLSAEQQPSYPPLTTRLMQDHIYSQATTSMDARPRYPPESIASEPPPLDRDMDWNHESISNYLSNEIQQIQLQQQQQASNPPPMPHPPATLVPETLKHPKATTSAQPLSAQHYFHRFFQTPGSDNPTPQPSTSESLNQPNMTSSSAFFYDTDSLETGLLVSPTSIPKHSSGARRREAVGSEFGADEFASTSRGIGPSTTSTARYNPQAMSGARPPRSMSHSAMNHRRRSEQPQPSNSLLNFTGPPIIMPHSSDRGMPDFSLLPLPGPIRFGNFGTAEKMLKQKIENQQRILGRSIPTGYYPHVNGNSSSSMFQQDLSAGHGNASLLPHDHVSSNRKNQMYSTSEFGGEDHSSSQRMYHKSKQERDQPRDRMFLAAATETSRRRSLSNGDTSHTSSPLSFDQLSKLCSSSKLESYEDENRQPGVETPRARSSQSPACVDNPSSSSHRRHESNETVNREGSTSSRSSRSKDKSSSPLCNNSSPAQLPRKIVFGDVEVSTEAAKEVRIKALAAVLRTRRMGSWSSQQSGSTIDATVSGKNLASVPSSDQQPGSIEKNKAEFQGVVQGTDVEDRSNGSQIGSESNRSASRDPPKNSDDSTNKTVDSSIVTTTSNVVTDGGPRSSGSTSGSNSGGSRSDSSSSSKNDDQGQPILGATTQKRRKRRRNKKDSSVPNLAISSSITMTTPTPTITSTTCPQIHPSQDSSSTHIIDLKQPLDLVTPTTPTTPTPTPTITSTSSNSNSNSTCNNNNNKNT